MSLFHLVPNRTDCYCICVLSRSFSTMIPSFFRCAAINPQTIFKRAQAGIFHGKTIQFGNNVPHSKHKTRRTWLPNVRTKRLHSDILERDIKFKITTRAMRTVKKYGGLDSYLLNVRTKWLGNTAMWWRLKLRDSVNSRELGTELDVAHKKLLQGVSGFVLTRVWFS